ncbi:MarR family winged helix-turn-helix transcriptional regulator [Thetidibacter halocola]|uniref:Winged helix-turn-helix transcriptional regulator n=1 Tax=Thetidibacter halocola TaxID=2827239 RepID=A0A8J8B7S5_9RHOB|nr:MarR family winged helix-turn-helix transcriptional regulator [Thetidibacter halocola]MBS0124009.1 winged helix-turn-helix transcriptional regulator [Thetidibacter halocola]
MDDGQGIEPDGLPAFDLGGFTPYRVALVAQRLSEALAREYRVRFGLSVPEWRVLAHLAQSDAVSVRDIEDAVAMEKSRVSRTAARLEARGLVAKRADPGDRRLVQLSLTGDGRAMMADLLPLASAFQGEIEAQLGTDFAGFDRALGRLLEAYRGG